MLCQIVMGFDFFDNFYTVELFMYIFCVECFSVIVDRKTMQRDNRQQSVYNYVKDLSPFRFKKELFLNDQC